MTPNPTPETIPETPETPSSASLADSWQDEADNLAKAHFDEYTAEWDDAFPSGYHDALNECAYRLRRAIGEAG